jgi:hypothetical protein
VAFSSRRDPSESDVSQQINKRLTLNLLIQGAAAHTFVTASHLVKTELEQIHPGLTELYDRFAISGQLNYCIGDNALMFGRPNLGWGLTSIPQKPFRRHRLLAKHGNQLAAEATQYLRLRARKKRLYTTPFLHWCQFMQLMVNVLSVEQGHAFELEALAVQAVTEIWNIPSNRLDGELTQQVAFGNLQPANTFMARICRKGAIGYGGVELREKSFHVVAKAWVFPLLVHELVKGTVELICLHGLGDLEDDVYRAVIDEADKLEYEAWLLQAGPEMWRKLIAVIPRATSLAQIIMQLARLEPQALENLLLQVIEHPDRARVALEDLGS